MGLGPSDRIQLITQDLNHPAKCAICHFPHDGVRPFLDFGLQIERYGSFYICAFCAVNVGQAVDMVTAQEFGELNSSYERMSEINFELKEALDDAHRGLDTIRSMFNLPAVTDVHLPEPEVDSESESTGAPESSTPVESGENVTVESSSGGGFADSIATELNNGDDNPLRI